MTHTIELTGRQRERLDEIKAECKEADPDVPGPTDEQMVSSLLDTWDAVGEGHYSLFGQRDHDTFRKAIETWGLPAQIDMAVEECGEVIVALQHLQRERADRREVIEELADIRIMFEQLRWYFGQDYVDPVVSDKMERLRERLENTANRQKAASRE